MFPAIHQIAEGTSFMKYSLSLKQYAVAINFDTGGGCNISEKQQCEIY